MKERLFVSTNGLPQKFIVRSIYGRAIAVAFLWLAGTGVALAANYPLEIINLKPVGTDGMTTNNRIYRAYPGIEYNVRAAVVGGAYPFSFSLQNAPAGMTVNAVTGEIRWPNPQANAAPTLVVRDAEGTQVSANWSISVTAAGFRFIDAVNGTHALGNGCTANCGTGTYANPWRTISDTYEGDRNASTYAGEFLYFRAGTYGVLDMGRGSIGSDWERVEFPITKPVVWLAYPGERPTIDFGYQTGVENAPLIRFGSGVPVSHVYVDGFETTRSRVIAFQLLSGGRYSTFRRLRMHDHGPSQDGSNGSHIMMTTSVPPSDYTVIQDSEFYQPYEPSELGIKVYGQNKLLIEDNVFHGIAGIELKNDARRYTVRRNTFYNIQGLAIGGNMHTETTHGEILFNNVRGNAPLALDLNQDAMAGMTHVYRNTFSGTVRVRNVITANGPFDLRHNVIVNGDSGTPAGSHVVYEYVVDPARIHQVDNLAGYPTDNIVDTGGNLTPAYAQYIGSRGHQLGTPPASPTNLRRVP
jgi:hypothetical protein